MAAQQGAFVDEEDKPERGRLSEFDVKGDQNVNLEEMCRQLENVHIQADVMRQRLNLEMEMSAMWSKLPFFMTSMACFIYALTLLSPADKISNVHQHLIKHFDMSADTLDGIRDFSDLYTYMEAFEHHNEEMQPTSAKYWCESRYSSHVWDFHLMVPRMECTSPRMYALGHTTNPAAAWSALNPDEAHGSGHSDGHDDGHDDHSSGHDDGHDDNSSGHGDNETYADHNDTHHAEELSDQLDFLSLEETTTTAHHRRLSGGEHAPVAAGDCVDDDEELAREEGEGMTCAGHKAEVCQTDVGVMFCPYSCGFCAPFTYKVIKKFDKPQLTMLPVVVFQTRYPKADCHGFAHIFEEQPYNQKLVLFPALDGERSSEVLTCINRNDGYYDELYAIKAPCPADAAYAPIAFCNRTAAEKEAGMEDGYIYDTHKEEYHGFPIYPKILTEAEKQIGAMRNIGWLDIQTAEVTLSTLVYTEGVEIFTSVSVIFKIDESGNMKAMKKLVSYRDLIDGSAGNQRTDFMGCIIVTVVFSCLGLLLSLRSLLRNPHCKFGFQCFETVSRSAMAGFAVVFLISWSQQPLMSEEYDHLLHSLLNWDEGLLGVKEFDSVIHNYIEVKEHIYAETEWLMKYRIAAYIVCYLQFVQLMLYFSAHPRMGTLTETLGLAATHMIHFLGMFMCLYLVLAFMAHWMFGGKVVDFLSYPEAIASQAKMLYGEWIYPDTADDLHGTELAMYWVYAGTFMLIVFFTLLNFFLAIVVDAFIRVKKREEDNVSENDFFTDSFDVIITWYTYQRHRWPRHSRIVRFFKNRAESINPSHASKLEQDAENTAKMLAEEQEERHLDKCVVKELQEYFPKEFGTDKQVGAFLLFYYKKCPWVLSKNEDGEVQQDQLYVSEGEADQVPEDVGDAVKNSSISDAQKLMLLKARKKEVSRRLAAAQERMQEAERRQRDAERRLSEAELQLKSNNDPSTLSPTEVAAQVAERVALASTSKVAQAAATKVAEKVKGKHGNGHGSSSGNGNGVAASNGNGVASNGHSVEASPVLLEPEMTSHSDEAALQQATEERIQAEEFLRTARKETAAQLDQARLLVEQALTQANRNQVGNGASNNYSNGNGVAPPQYADGPSAAARPPPVRPRPGGEAAPRVRRLRGASPKV